MKLRLDHQRSIHFSAGTQKILLYLASFFIPFAGMLIVIAYLRIMPFGPHTLGFSDGMGATGALIGFGNLLRNPDSILYSFGGLGGSAWSGYAWGGLMPTKVIGLLANVDNAPEILTWMDLINIALCGLTMYILFSALGGHKASHLIFSTSYAMMGFNATFFHEYIFMIGPQMLPLVVLGLIWIMRGRAPWLYILSLAFSIFINAYFGFMLCVVSVIVFFAYACAEWDDVRGRMKGILLNYTISSLIAGLLAAFMWLPAIQAYSGRDSRLAKIAVVGVSQKESFPFLRGFSKLFTGASNGSEVLSGLPNIFCGMLVVGLTVLFLISRGNQKKRKICFWAILLFYYLTFYIPPLNIFMHGGSEPNGFFYRYSYVFSFFMILAAASAFQDLGEYSTDDLKRSGLVIVIGTMIVFLFPYDFISGVTVVVDMILIALMGLLIYFGWRKRGRLQKDMAIALLFFLTCGNLFANFGMTVYNMRSIEMDISQYYTATLDSGSMITAIKSEDKDIYRMEEDFLNNGLVGFDAGLFGYRSVNSFGPSVRQFIHRSLCRLGLNWLNISHWYSASAPAATDALLGMRYIITNRDLAAEKGYERILASSRYSTYRNDNALPFAILANQACGDIELSNNAFDNVNQIWKGMTGGGEDIFTLIEDVQYSLDYNQKWSFSNSEIAEMVAEDRVNDWTGAHVNFSFTAPKDGVAYYYNTGIAEKDFGENTVSTHFAGVCRQGETVTGRMELPEGISSDNVFPVLSKMTFAVADNALLRDYAKLLKQRDISFNIIKGHDLTGEFSAETGQRVLFTLPWDGGWTAYIDGQEVPIHKTWDLFMSIEVPAGHHTYEMKFLPLWMNYGIYISCAALACLILYFIVWTLRKKLRPRKPAE